MKHFLLALALVASLGITACQAPPATVACTVTVESATVGCTIDGVSVTGQIPANVASIIGLVGPVVEPVLPPGSVSIDAAARAAASPPIACVANTKTKAVTCKNGATGASGTFSI